MEYFVPSNIIDKIARVNEDARKTAIASHKSRENRNKETERINNNAFNAAFHTPSSKTPRVIIYDCENTWQQRLKPAQPTDPTAIKVKDYVEFTIKYLKDTYNRNGIDNRGTDIYVNIHYGERFMNAFWDGVQYTAGDGDGVIFASFANSLEVNAHEMAHGIVQHACGLVYQDQPGALNEHYSDVIGTCIQQAYLNQDAKDADWLVGNEIMGPQLYGESLRSMSFPGTAYNNSLLGKDEQPAHMRDLWTSPEDHGGVHYNSGIPNRVFYLVSLELGTHESGKLWYKSLHKLWPTANFVDMFNVTVEVAREMVKNQELPPGATQIVRAAFNEVGIT